jgi:penicillin amidase
VKRHKGLLQLSQLLGCIFGLGLIIIVLSRPLGEIQPLGLLISPYSGVWRHSPTSEGEATVLLADALKSRGMGNVEIIFDKNGVPHISSDKDQSVYFAQGFITAYFRLWQMDFLSRLTAGRVSEIIGAKALPVDRFFRRLKLPAAAEASTDLMLNDVATRDAILSYISGVNARIEQLEIDSIPFEYRIFGTHPEPWTPERVAYLSKYLTWELTGYMYDHRFTETKHAISKQLLDLLFPLNSHFPSTIIGDDDLATNQRKNIATRTTKSRNPNYLSESEEVLSNFQIKIPELAAPDTNNGSNNWAIHGSLSSTGKPIISNDIHLSYTLPALWFPIQLTTPNQNVYGASLPGSPGVIIGFNENVSWAVTNGTNDVLDWYRLKFRDETHREYLFNGSWRPVIMTEEKIWLPDGRYEKIQTRESHIGPILFEKGDREHIAETPEGLAIQWTGLIPSNELKTFLLLNRADKTASCLDSLNGYVAPPQNFLCADRFGKVAYRLSGIFPVREGRDGRSIEEAISSRDIWQGFLSPEESPHKNQVDDYIVSANQAPFNGERQSKFGWFFANPFRAESIRGHLENARKRGKISPKDIIAIQADERDLSTLKFIRWTQQKLAHEGINFSKQTQKCLDEVDFESWDGQHRPNSKAAVLASEWLVQLEAYVWRELIGPEKTHFWPQRWRLLETITNDQSFAQLHLPISLSAILNQTLDETCRTLNDHFHRIPNWSDYQVTQIRHTARLPGLGIKSVVAGGTADSIFANKGQHGPTWKMVVSMENPPRAWSMIPGGKNGDPSSREYDGTLQKWSTGEMQPVYFFLRKASK